MFTRLSINHFLLVMIFLGVLHSPSLAQNKWEKAFSKNDLQYEKGKYKKARKNNQRLIRKSKKKLGPENNMLVQAYFREALYYAAAGYIDKYRQSIEKGLEMATYVHGENPTANGIALLEPVKIYTRFGDFLKADSLLTLSRKLLALSGNLSPELDKTVKMCLAQIHAGQGFYTQALASLNELHPFISDKTRQKSITYTDEKKHETKTRKLSSKEQKLLFQNYADYLNLVANIYRMQGNHAKADSVLSLGRNWISKNLSKNDARYSKNLLIQGDIYYLHGDYKNCLRRYEKAYSLISRKYHKGHQQVIATQENLLKMYLQEGKKNKYQNMIAALKRRVNQYYNRKSIYHTSDDYVKLFTPLDKGNIQFLTKRAKKLIDNKSNLPAKSERKAEVLEFLYLTSIINQEYEEGKQYLTEVLDIKKALYGEKAPVYHLSKLKLANHFIDYTNDLSEANSIYDESFTNTVGKEITPGHPDYVNIINHQAELYELFDNYQEASLALEKGLQTTRESFKANDLRQVITLERFSDLQLKIGDYKAANYNINLAIEILKKNKDENSLIHHAKVLETRARLFAIQGLYDEARADIHRSEKLIAKSDITAGIYDINTIDDLAQLYIETGKYSKAEKLVNKSLEERTKQYGEDSRKLIKTFTELGRLQYIKGAYTEAEKSIQKALQLAVGSYGEGSSKTCEPRILLSNVYKEIGDLEKAKEQSHKALNIRLKHFGPAHIQAAKAYAQLAGIQLLLKDDSNEIESMLQTAGKITIDKLGADNPLYAEIIQQLAALYIRQNQFQKAHDLLNEASKIWVDKTGKRNNINAATIASLSGDIYYRQQRYAEAATYFQKAKKRYERIFDKKHPSYVKVLSKLSKVHYMTGNFRHAKGLMEEALSNYNIYIKNYFSTLSEKQKHKYWHTIRDDFEYFNTLALKHPDLIGEMYNNALATKALLLNSSIKIKQRILNSNDEALKTKYAEWVDLKEMQAGILSMNEEQIAGNGINVALVEEEIETLEKFLSEKSTLFATKIEDANINWKDIRNALDEKEVAMEMVRFRYFDGILTDSIIYAFLFVQKDTKGTPEVVFLNNGKVLESRYFNYYRNALRFGLEDIHSYESFWEPIKSRLGNYTTLYLSPDGIYNQINLETIPTPQNQYVIDEANIVVLKNTKELHFRKSLKTETLASENTAFILGNPEFYEGNNDGRRFITPLPASEDEVRRVSTMLREKGYTFDFYTHRQATEPVVKSTKSPKIFHVATHGFFEASEEVSDGDNDLSNSWQPASQNPLLRSGILLANSGDLLKQATFQYNNKDGVLTAFEAMNLNLDQTELVVLSACETGLGQVEIGEGVYGLQRAFLQAGAKSLIMSLFKVRDDATQQLMTNFYEKWLDSGDKRASFVAAKKEIRNQYPNPLDWGAFVMIGLGQ